MKLCNKCLIEKPLTDFYTKRYWYDNDSEKRFARVMCKVCWNAYNRKNLDKSQKKHKWKQKIRTKTNQLIKNGAIKRSPCKVCNATANIHTHHLNYKSSKSVIFLCRQHHEDIHHNRLTLKPDDPRKNAR